MYQKIMGSDLHWMFERKDYFGVWHNCATDSYWFEKYYSAFPENPQSCDFDFMYSQTSIRLRDRNYNLFWQLSGVRGPQSHNQNKLLHSEWPKNVSPAAKKRLKCRDFHSYGWILGSEMESWTNEAGKWAKLVHKFIKEGGIDFLEPECERKQNGEYFWKYMSKESAHERLQRFDESRILLPLSPENWRVLVCYDN